MKLEPGIYCFRNKKSGWNLLIRTLGDINNAGQIICFKMKGDCNPMYIKEEEWDIVDGPFVDKYFVKDTLKGNTESLAELDDKYRTLEALRNEMFSDIEKERRCVWIDAYSYILRDNNYGSRENLNDTANKMLEDFDNKFKLTIPATEEL